MDSNQRVLSQVLEERSAHGFRRPGSTLLLTCGLVAVVVAIGALLRLAASSSVGGVPAPDTQIVDTTAAPAAARTPESLVSGAQPADALIAAPRRYVVQAGDDLASIAARSGLSPTTLASVNQLDDPDLVQPGEELEIPATDGVLHVVAPGETLRSIAQKYNVDVKAVVAANRMTDPDHIVPGVRLFIPLGHAGLTGRDDTR